jgi:hypothetical protein
MEGLEDVRMAVWQGGGLQDGRTAGGQEGRIAGWQYVRMAG